MPCCALSIALAYQYVAICTVAGCKCRLGAGSRGESSLLPNYFNSIHFAIGFPCGARFGLTLFLLHTYIFWADVCVLQGAALVPQPGNDRWRWAESMLKILGQGLGVAFFVAGYETDKLQKFFQIFSQDTAEREFRTQEAGCRTQEARLPDPGQGQRRTKTVAGTQIGY